MPFADMRQFIAKLDAAGELLTVDAPVDPDQELGAICRDTLDERGPAMLFHNVTGYAGSVMANMLGSRTRLALAVETTEEELTERYIELTRRSPMTDLPLLDDAPCKEVTIKASELVLENPVPPIVANIQDTGPFINYGLVIVKDPDTGRRNMSINRMLLKGDNRTGCWSNPPAHCGAIRKKWEARREPMEVAVALGADPMLYIASQVPGLNLGDDEIELAAAMRGEAIDLVKCDTLDLEVPANCEMVLEGRVIPNDYEIEGQYGEYPGYYGVIEEQPMITFHHATHRKDPIYPFSYLGVPPTETHALGQLAGEAGFLYRLRSDVAPTVKEVYCPPDMMTVIVSLQKTYEEQAKHVIYSLWTNRVTKTIIVVDDDIDPRDQERVYWAIATRSDPERDVIKGDGYCTTGPSREKYKATSWTQMGIDATEPLQGYPDVVRPSDEMMARARSRRGELRKSGARKLRTGT